MCLTGKSGDYVEYKASAGSADRIGAAAPSAAARRGQEDDSAQGSPREDAHAGPRQARLRQPLPGTPLHTRKNLIHTAISTL